MALVNPKIPYVTIRNSLMTLFKNNKTALNVNLSANTFTADTQIKKGNPERRNTFVSEYPVIYVEFTDRSEEFLNIGAAGRKRPVVTIRVWGTVRDISEDYDDEILYLTENIEGLIRDNIQFDSNVLFADPVSSTWGVGVTEGTYVNGVAIDIDCTLDIK